jgi:hypothetical protein
MNHPVDGEEVAFQRVGGTLGASSFRSAVPQSLMGRSPYSSTTTRLSRNVWRVSESNNTSRSHTAL